MMAKTIDSDGFNFQNQIEIAFFKENGYRKNVQLDEQLDFE